MKKIVWAAILTMAISSLLVSCDSDDSVVQTQTPTLAPLAWGQRSWDNALWQ